MMTALPTEIDVDQLMSAIREAALKRPLRLAVLPANHAVAAPQPYSRLTLSPEFTNANATSYHVNELLKYQDRDFIRNAYLAILKREPDSKGFRHNLELLQSGAFNKIDIIASLRYSDEGNHTGVTIDGLQLPATIRKLERIPIIGYLIQLLIALVRLPSMIRNQRQFQSYLVAQQFLLADHFNDAQHIATNDLQRQGATLQSLTTLTTLPQDLQNVHQQLNALESKVNQTVLTRMLAEQQKLQHAEARLLLLSDRLDHTSQAISQTRDELRNEWQQQVNEQHATINSLTTDVQTLSRNIVNETNRTIAELQEWDSFYAAFEEKFRGSTEEVEERLRFYLPYLADLDRDSNILDLGSGRGDWLELLTKEGFHPRGIEVNEALAESSRARDLEIINTEMMVHLGQQPDNSLDVISIFHLVEHFNVGRLIRLLGEVRRTLKPGGRLLIETPSPENLVVGACNFYADPTHYKPIYPQTLVFLLENKGFTNVDLQFLHPVDNSPFIGKSEGSEQLNTWLFGPRDFAVIARKAQ
jgi:SAM-dependent methyltransferase